jgi:hypothetical protein
MATEQRKLQAYLVKQVLAVSERGTVAPELMDTIGGTTEAEVDASISKAERASAAMVARFRSEMARPSDVDPAWQQANVREGTTADDLLAARIQNMTMAEYAANREQLGTHTSLVNFLGGTA